MQRPPFLLIPPTEPQQSTMSDTKQFTYSDVSEHTSKKDLYLVIHDKVYNTSSFVDEHPYVVTLSSGGTVPLSPHSIPHTRTHTHTPPCQTHRSAQRGKPRRQEKKPNHTRSSS